MDIITQLTALIDSASHFLTAGGTLIAGAAAVWAKNKYHEKRQTPRRDYDNGSRVVVTQATLDARDKQIAEQSIATNKRIDDVGKRIGNLHDLVIRLDKTIAVMAAKMKIKIEDDK